MPGQSGDDAVKAADAQPWDPSVKSLLAFPQVIQTMGDKPGLQVQNLGRCLPRLVEGRAGFRAAPQELVAQATGSLKSSEQQTVAVGQAPQAQESVITIEPANPQVVYVPAYDPSIVYGTWPYPAYPPYYYPSRRVLLSRRSAGERHCVRCIGVAAVIGGALGQLQLGRRQRQHQRGALQQQINVNRKISG